MPVPHCLTPQPPHRRSDRVSPKSPSPPFGKPRRCVVRRRPRASPHAPAPPPRSEASPGAKPPHCLRPPSCPPPDSRVRRFLPAPSPGLSVLAIPAALPASAIATEGPLIIVRARVLHGPWVRCVLASCATETCRRCGHTRAVGAHPGVRAQRGSAH
jgi:hypothetical protein